MNRLWRDWTLSCALGEFIGIGLAGIVATIMIVGMGEPQNAVEAWGAYAAMVAVGAVEGSAIGYFQWRVLHRLFPVMTARAWVGATLAVAVLGWAVGMLPSTLTAGAPQPEAASAQPALWLILLMSAGIGAAAGLVFGFAQWLVLRRHAAHSAHWMLSNMGGWAVAMAWIFLAASWPDESTPKLIVVLGGLAGGALAGLSIGAVTGLSLLRLARQTGGGAS